MKIGRALLVLGLFCGGLPAASAAPVSFKMQEIEAQLGVGYAVLLHDLNQDQKLDIVVVDTDRVMWYENPSWKMHLLIQGQTELDNVCIAPHDIDNDGRTDFALGAYWKPNDRVKSGTLQWLKPGAKAEDRWTVHPIDREPTIHRIRWADLEHDGRPELVVVPLFGQNTSPPDYKEAPLRVLAYSPPKDPVRDPWERKVLNEDLHVSHNLEPADLDGRGQLDLLLASFEGVSLLRRAPDGQWLRTLIGTGDQVSRPNRGASEIRYGKLTKGNDYIATIEPWHGNQVVAYTRPKAGETLWQRKVLDEALEWGHAVACANLDLDPEQELIIGVRNHKGADAPCGVRIYDPQNAAGTEWERQLVDPAGVAVEDLTAADLNSDGRIDIVAVGRQTKNVRIYWNQGSGN